jgi:hypothetical protein
MDPGGRAQKEATFGCELCRLLPTRCFVQISVTDLIGPWMSRNRMQMLRTVGNTQVHSTAPTKDGSQISLHSFNA